MSIHKLPLHALGLKNMPAVPFKIKGLLSSLVKLELRVLATKQATYGLSNTYTIGGITAPAYPFLFGESGDCSEATEDDGGGGSVLGNLLSEVKEKVEDYFEDDDSEAGDASFETRNRADHGAPARAKLRSMLEKDPGGIRKFLIEHLKPGARPLVEARTAPMTGLSLDDPKQFSMGWTTFGNVDRDARPDLDKWASSLTDADEANRQLWPTIADFGLAYNLLILKKIGGSEVEDVKGKLGASWDEDMDTAYQKGLLYVIDLTIFESIEPQEADGCTRFTPATLTVLRQDPKTKALTPLAIRVSGSDGSDAQGYVRGQTTDGAWLYALQAVKTSVTVYGIWLGHVYHWHMVTAAMQMTMFNTFAKCHPIYELVAPQSSYLMEFDVILLLLWESISPPTSITSGWQFLKLIDTFADGREYFDDDPTTALEKLGIREEDFTIEKPWDQYRLVGLLLELWKATGEYVQAFVDHTYADDAAVADDDDLQKWIQDSSDADGGNVRGLPTMDNRTALVRVLTSLIFRVTAHGNPRLSSSANPVLNFVANYPPCLQQSTIPEPGAEIGTRKLLEALPKTGAIGKTLNFYYSFLYSSPYETFVPLDGVDHNLFFPGGMYDPRNKALVAFRQAIIRFMTTYQDESPSINQWPLNIET